MRHLQEDHEEDDEEEEQEEQEEQEEEEALAARRPGLGEVPGLHRRRDGPVEDQAEEDCLPEA